MNTNDYHAHYEFVEAVLQKKLDSILVKINDANFMNKNPFSWTPLHYAVALNNLEVTRKILENNNGYVNILDRYQRSPLSIAALRGNSTILRLLLAKGADVKIGSPLCYAATKGDSGCVLALIQSGCDVDEVDNINDYLKYVCRYTPLIIAIEQNHPEIIQLLIKHGADTNFGVNKHLTPLHIACQNGTLEMVKAVLSKQTELNSRCQHDNLPLDYALLNDKFDIIKYLLEAGASVNNVGKMVQTPLHTAIYCSKIEYIKEILKYEPDLNIRDIDGATPLYLCCYNWKINEDIFECLIDNGADVSIKCNRGWTPLHLCCAVGNLKCVKLLLEKLSADCVNAVTMDNITPLYIAACKGHIEICKELLEKGAYVNIRINKFRDLCSFYPFDMSEDQIKVGYAAENIAAEKERHDIVELINCYKENHPDRNVENVKIINLTRANTLDEMSCEGLNVEDTDVLGWTCLHYAAEIGHYNLMKFCIDKTKDVNVTDRYGRTPLTLAAANGNLDVVKLLTENGAKGNIGYVAFYTIENNQIECLKHLLNNNNIESQDRRKRTPVMYAAIKNNFPILEELVERSMDVTQKDEDDETALHLARNTSRDFIKCLMENNADVNAQNSCEETPLFAAVIRKNMDVIETLLENGADPNIANHFKQTPLHYLAEYGTAQFVEKLLKYSPDVNAADDDSFTPFLESLQNEDMEVLKLLLEYGADLGTTLRGGWTALHICAYYGELAAAEELIRRNIDVNSLSQDGVSPLYIASARGHRDFVKMLLRNGSLLDTPIMCLKDWREQPHIASKLPRLERATPLVAAICNGHLEIVKTLHSAGASISIEIEGQMNPLRLTVTNSHYAIFDYLTDQSIELNLSEKEKLCELAGSKNFEKKIRTKIFA